MAAPKGNKYAKGNKGGRPAKLDESNVRKVAKEMLSFFEVRYDDFKGKIETWINNDLRKGRPIVDVPFYADFARQVGISYRTLKECEENGDKEFSQAWQKCKEIQGRYIALAALNGLSNHTFSIFVASNLTDWRDKKQLTGKNDGPVALTVAEMDDAKLAELAGVDG